MILQALYQYYQRKTEDPDTKLAPFGFEWKELPFIFEIDTDGNLIQIEDTREGSGRKKTARSFLIPKGVKRSVNVRANLLWGNAEYLLGLHDWKKRRDAKKKGKVLNYRNRLVEMHQAFVDKIQSIPVETRSDLGVKSVIRFLEKLDLNDLRHRLRNNFRLRKDLRTLNPNIAFRLQGDIDLVCQRPAVQIAVGESQKKTPNIGICLITGERNEIERLHPAIKGVWGAQSSGGNVVSFNLDAFDSYTKRQSYNAPVSKQASFAYTTALNHLLRKGSSQRIQVGDSSTVFWAEKTSELETRIVDIFGEPHKDDPDKGTRAVNALYKSIDAGLLNTEEGNTRFYVLGLAPNAARIAVRFWEVATVGELALRIQRHFDDLAIVHGDKQLPHLPLFRLLVSIATQGKADNIPPNLAGEVIRSILTGLPYPQTLLVAALRRIRAEQEIDYPRAALIKACINRNARYSNPELTEELKVSLDESNTNVGYRLGQLFAVLEKVQEEANPGINATIRDRYYGAASSTPVSVFSTLLKLKNHHLSKLENRGRVINLEKLLGNIIEGIDDFPAVLSPPDQGRFAIGYYHQRQDFFKKHDDPKKGAHQ